MEAEACHSSPFYNVLDSINTCNANKSRSSLADEAGFSLDDEFFKGVYDFLLLIDQFMQFFHW